MPSVEQQSLRSVRFAARAPRWAFFALVGVLSLSAVTDIVRPAPEPLVAVPSRAASASSAVDVAGIAEGFARAYLAYDVGAPQDRERALRAYLAGDLDAQAGFVAPMDGARRVTWTATVAQRRLDRHRTAVTVAAALDHRPDLEHLVVTVTRARGGALTVATPPALVGTPSTAPDVRSPDGDEVEDPALRAVLERALGNYLAGERGNLRADLAPGARLPVPSSRLRLADVTDLRRLRPGQVAATVVAHDRRGAALTLRYELAVVRRDRWYVAGLLTDPTTPKGPR